MSIGTGIVQGKRQCWIVCDGCECHSAAQPYLDPVDLMIVRLSARGRGWEVGATEPYPAKCPACAGKGQQTTFKLAAG